VVSSMPRPHFTPGKDPVPILQEAGWAPGPAWRGGKSRAHQDSILDRPARSQSLYRLSYSTHRETEVHGAKPDQCRFVQRACHRNWRGTGDTTLQMLWTKESLSRKTGVNECSYKLETCLIVCPRFMTARGKVTLARRP